MGIFSGGLHVFSELLSGYGRDDAPVQPDMPRPMQPFIDECRLGGEFALSDVIAMAQQRGLGGQALTDFTGLDCRGMVFDEAGVRMVQDDPLVSPDAQINVSGSELGGCVFRPASTANHIVFDLVTIDGQTAARDMVFSGFDEEGASVMFRNMDVSGLSIDGHPASMTCNMEIQLDGCTATQMDIADSRYTEIYARPSDNGAPSDLSYMRADGARALRLEAEGGIVDGSSFERSTFAPGSSLCNSRMIGVSFDDAAVGNLNVSGAIGYGTSWENVDITHMQMDGLCAFPQDFVGAVMQGERISSPEQAQLMLAERGVAFATSPAAVREATQWVAQIENTGRMSTEMPVAAAPAIAGWDAAQVPTPGADALIAALEANMLAGAAYRTTSDAGHDLDVMQGMATALAATPQQERPLRSAEILSV